MLFHPTNRTRTEARKRLYAAIELVYTAVDFAAALCFIIGSVMFLWDDWQMAATWFFIAGSIFFALKPLIRLGREIKLAAMGDETDLAKRAGLDVDD